MRCVLCVYMWLVCSNRDGVSCVVLRSDVNEDTLITCLLISIFGFSSVHASQVIKCGTTLLVLRWMCVSGAAGAADRLWEAVFLTQQQHPLSGALQHPAVGKQSDQVRILYSKLKNYGTHNYQNNHWKPVQWQLHDYLIPLFPLFDWCKVKQSVSNLWFKLTIRCDHHPEGQFAISLGQFFKWWFCLLQVWSFAPQHVKFAQIQVVLQSVLASAGECHFWYLVFAIIDLCAHIHYLLFFFIVCSILG